MLSQPLLTVHETAQTLKVKESTVRSWIRNHKLRAIKFGREWRVAVVDLEKFLNDDRLAIPILVKAALVHVQFETIHPFLDGNGRIGRLLVTLLLCHAAVLKDPLLYLSLYLKERRPEYYRLLDVVRAEGDWESWLDFFLEGIHTTADGAVGTAKRLVNRFHEDRDRIQERGGRAIGSSLRVHDALRLRPVSTLKAICKLTRLSFPGAAAGMAILSELGIAREMTGRRRNRIFAYDRYLSILSEGTEAA